MFDSGNLQAFHYSEAGYGQQNMETFAEPAALAVQDQNKDAEPDLILAGTDIWSWHWGEVSAEGRWSTVDAPFQSLGVNRYDGFLPVASGPTAEFARVYAGSNMTVFTRYALEPGIDQIPVEAGWTVLTYEERALLDSEVCDDIAWVLLDGLLVRVSLQGASPTVTGTLDTQATRVICGAGPSNAKAAVLGDETIELLDNALNPVDTVLVAGAQDLAFGRLNGEATMNTCSAANCSIDAWFVNGPQSDSVWVTGGDEVRVTDGDALEVAYSVAAGVQVMDADGNGEPDVVLHQPGKVLGTIRGIGAPMELWTAPKQWAELIWSADVDGDGLPEFWVVDQVGDIGFVQASDD